MMDLFETLSNAFAPKGLELKVVEHCEICGARHNQTDSGPEELEVDVFYHKILEMFICDSCWLKKVINPEG